MNMDEPLGNDEILKLNILLNSFLQGLTLNDINIELVHTMKVQAGMHADILEGVFNGIVEAIHEADNLEIYTSGATNMLKYPELSNPEHTTALLDTLVEKKQLVKLVDDTVNQEEKHGIQVYIGNETQVQSLRDCSIVTATYELKEGGTGTVGIIGPKRMDYRKVVNTLRNLTDDLDEIFNNKSQKGEEEKKVSDESIVEEAKGETPEETTTEEGTETQETKETKTKKKKKSAAALEIELKKSEEKAAEMTDKYQRLMAEFENARKRNAKEQSHMYDVGAKEVLAKLLPVVDNFERGLGAMTDADKQSSFAQGFIKIYQQMITVLEEIGVKPMDAVGKEFNPDFHNAVMHEENEEMGENLVSEEFQKGYMYKDGVLRHSMVKVVNQSYFRYTNLTEYRRK